MDDAKGWINGSKQSDEIIDEAAVAQEQGKRPYSQGEGAAWESFISNRWDYWAPGLATAVASRGRAGLRAGSCSYANELLLGQLTEAMKAWVLIEHWSPCFYPQSCNLHHQVRGAAVLQYCDSVMHGSIWGYRRQGACSAVCVLFSLVANWRLTDLKVWITWPDIWWLDGRLSLAYISVCIDGIIAHFT